MRACHVRRSAFINPRRMLFFILSTISASSASSQVIARIQNLQVVRIAIVGTIPVGLPLHLKVSYPGRGVGLGTADPGNLLILRAEVDFLFSKWTQSV